MVDKLVDWKEFEMVDLSAWKLAVPKVSKLVHGQDLMMAVRLAVESVGMLV